MKNEKRAEEARKAARDLGDLLYEKQTAYGDAGRMNLKIWEARLEQYLTEDGNHYLIPRALIAHLGRLTRIDDRIARIVSNPVADHLGEDPWRDLAGDAVIGMIMPRSGTTDPSTRHPDWRPPPRGGGFDPIEELEGVRRVGNGG